ncbi:FAD-dependent oxidoreductase [Dyella telluris]|uniref:Cholesterol oxidase n=1 Tax=Dyella telluris TaxID=2763498 RepID=A0A7G8PZC6_9GAMM|nr:FAD-dependent oxidoreductase [Dyella telluris]QNJ99883.1 GMC family oxidoreductase [Dyella telluris]
MTEHTFDVVVIGSGFGGSVAALRAAEKGYSVAVLEAGRRLAEHEMPATSWDLGKYLWAPALGLYGMQRVENLGDVSVVNGAGVGGGSNVYANTLYVPPKKFFHDAMWSGITNWADEAAPYIDQARRMLGVERIPYGLNDSDRMLKQTAESMGRGHTFNQAPAGIYFGTPGVTRPDPYFGGAGPDRTGCINCGHCLTGCGRNAKNKTTLNYLYLAEKRGAKVFDLQEAFDIVPLDGGGYEVHARHPGWLHRALHAEPTVYRCKDIVIAAHAYGTSHLLLRLRHTGRLDKLSDKAGTRARTNSEQILSVRRPTADWKLNPDRMIFSNGQPAITCGVWPDDQTSIENVSLARGSNVMGLLFGWHQQGEQQKPFHNWVKELLTHPDKVLSPGWAHHWSDRSFVLLCMQTTDTSVDLHWEHNTLRARSGPGEAPKVHIPVVEDFHNRLARMFGLEEGGVIFETFNMSATAHFIGGMPIAEKATDGAVDPYQRLFGHPGIHVMDGSVMPANPGVNPSLMITALAERAMSFWPHKGGTDMRPPLGSGYQRIAAIPPRHPAVPAGAPAEYRLDATADAIIPEFPF